MFGVVAYRVFVDKLTGNFGEGLIEVSLYSTTNTAPHASRGGDLSRGLGGCLGRVYVKRRGN